VTDYVSVSVSLVTVSPNFTEFLGADPGYSKIAKRTGSFQGTPVPNTLEITEIAATCVCVAVQQKKIPMRRERPSSTQGPEYPLLGFMIRSAALVLS